MFLCSSNHQHHLYYNKRILYFVCVFHLHFLTLFWKDDKYRCARFFSLFCLFHFISFQFSFFFLWIIVISWWNVSILVWVHSWKNSIACTWACLSNQKIIINIFSADFHSDQFVNKPWLVFSGLLSLWEIRLLFSCFTHWFRLDDLFSI